MWQCLGAVLILMMDGSDSYPPHPYIEIIQDQSFPGAFSGTTGEKPGNNIGGERSVRGAAKDISAVLGLFPGVIGPC